MIRSQVQDSDHISTQKQQCSGINITPSSEPIKGCIDLVL